MVDLNGSLCLDRCMETTTTTTYRAVVLHGENGEFGRSMNAQRDTLIEAEADAKRLAAEILTKDHGFPRSVCIEQTAVHTTTQYIASWMIT